MDTTSPFLERSLTPDEMGFLEVCRIALSNEAERLLAIIDRLAHYSDFSRSAPLPWDLTQEEVGAPYCTPGGNRFNLWPRSDSVEVLGEEGDVVLSFEWPRTAGQLVDLLVAKHRAGLETGTRVGREILKIQLRQLIGAADRDAFHESE